MAASLNVAQPIKAYKVLLGGTANAALKRLPEKATQTFKIGVPVQVDAATGFIFEAPAIVSAATALIAGFSTEPGNNLTTSGVAKTITYGSVQNQSAAVLIPLGVPPSDGTMGFTVAEEGTEFIGVLGNSNTAANATVAATDVGAIFGMTKDATNGFWYIDNFITTVANGACVVIQQLVDAVGTLNGRESFKVTNAAMQLSR